MNLFTDSNHINLNQFMHLAQTFLFFFYLGVSLLLINPGLVPQPEPYFDLTLIRVTHTKIPLPKDLNQ
jgi:hypothetical protein